MALKRSSYILGGALIALALAGCGAPTAAAPKPEEVLPTPPPQPTALIVAPTAVPPTVASKPQVSGELLLSDDFGGALSGWKVVDTSASLGAPTVWKTNAGRLDVVSSADDAPGDYASALVTGDSSWTDYAVSAAAYPTENDEIGVVARVSGGNFYVFRLTPAGSNGKIAISYFNADQQRFTDIVSAPGGYTAGQWTQLQLKVQGNTLQALVDGRQVLQGQDSTLSSGQAGVYGFATGGLSFDTFQVSR